MVNKIDIEDILGLTAGLTGTIGGAYMRFNIESRTVPEMLLTTGTVGSALFTYVKLMDIVSKI